MKIFLRILKIIACIFGGGVAASVILLVVVSLVSRDPDQQMRLLDRWIWFVRFFGAVCGGLIVYRSERRKVQRV
jgi:hypothetical protein